MEWERWEQRRDREDEADIERMKEKSRKRLIELIHSKFNEPNLATLFGGGEKGLRMADLITRLRFDLPLDGLMKPGEAKKPSDGTPTPDMNESGGIQPDQSKSN